MPCYVLSLITVMFVAPTDAQHRSTDSHLLSHYIESLNLFAAFKRVRACLMNQTLVAHHPLLFRVQN